MITADYNIKNYHSCGGKLDNNIIIIVNSVHNIIQLSFIRSRFPSVERDDYNIIIMNNRHSKIRLIDTVETSPALSM